MSKNRISKAAGLVGAVALPGLALQTLVIKLGATAASGTEVATGKKIPARSLVLGVYVDMATGASSATAALDVGTLSTASGGDADGFLASLVISTDGVKQGSLLASARTLGALSQVGSAASQIFAQPALIDIEREVSVTNKGVTSAQNGEVVILYAKL